MTAKLYPRRMGQAYEALAAQGKTESAETLARSWEPWSIEACAHSRDLGSLLTGKLYIALDFLPASPRAAFDASIRPLELPTVNGTFQELEANVGRLVKKVNDLPLEQIAADLHTDLKDLHETLSELHTQVLPNAVGYFVGPAWHARFCRSDFGRGIALATRPHGDLVGGREHLAAVRELADYLDRHPDALLRGRRAAEDAAGTRAVVLGGQTMNG